MGNGRIQYCQCIAITKVENNIPIDFSREIKGIKATCESEIVELDEIGIIFEIADRIVIFAVINVEGICASTAIENVITVAAI